MNKNNIDHMVDRFLTWEFPADFNPDGAIAFNRNPDYPMPVGTNLLTATQAKAMIEYIVEGMTYTQADVDAAVAAALEKVAQTLDEKAKSTREKWDRAPTLSAKITYRHHREALEASAEIVRELIPTDALAEHDAKVRADAGGIEAIAAERQRQIEREGWTPEHDDQHSKGEISAAAAAYAFSAFTNTSYRAFAADPVGFWPWDERYWKPRTPREDLVRAGALIAAEIDRLDRIEGE